MSPTKLEGSLGGNKEDVPSNYQEKEGFPHPCAHKMRPKQGMLSPLLHWRHHQEHLKLKEEHTGDEKQFQAANAMQIDLKQTKLLS